MRGREICLLVAAGENKGIPSALAVSEAVTTASIAAEVMGRHDRRAVSAHRTLMECNPHTFRHCPFLTSTLSQGEWEAEAAAAWMLTGAMFAPPNYNSNYVPHLYYTVMPAPSFPHAAEAMMNAWGSFGALVLGLHRRESAQNIAKLCGGLSLTNMWREEHQETLRVDAIGAEFVTAVIATCVEHNRVFEELRANGADPRAVVEGTGFEAVHFLAVLGSPKLVDGLAATAIGKGSVPWQCGHGSWCTALR